MAARGEAQLRRRCISANPGFAGATVSGHFAWPAPVPGDPVPARSVTAHLALRGPLLDDFDGAGSLPRILYGPGPSVLFRGLDLGRGILHSLYRGSLHGPCGLGLRPCIFLGRPGLELLEQGFSDGLADLGLALTASAWLCRPGPGPDRQVQQPQQFRRAPARPLPAANPACWRLIALSSSTDRWQAELPICRPMKP